MDKQKISEKARATGAREARFWVWAIVAACAYLAVSAAVEYGVFQ